jgi:hypothetical protein
MCLGIVLPKLPLTNILAAKFCNVLRIQNWHRGVLDNIS